MVEVGGKKDLNIGDVDSYDHSGASIFLLFTKGILVFSTPCRGVITLEVIESVQVLCICPELQRVMFSSLLIVIKYLLNRLRVVGDVTILLYRGRDICPLYFSEVGG